jgi:uncharacterized paraquat-inducible protein A
MTNHIRNTIVKCDKCDWALKIENPEDVKKWHNVKCPKCHDSIIISDNDMAILNHFLAISKFQDLIDPKNEMKSIDVHINTAGLRGG